MSSDVAKSLSSKLSSQPAMKKTSMAKQVCRDNVLQSTLRCNADYQYKKRAPPYLEMKAEAEYLYQMKAEAEYQRKMTADSDTQYQKTSTAQQPSATEQRQSDVYKLTQATKANNW